jgi:hypothetical protein
MAMSDDEDLNMAEHQRALLVRNELAEKLAAIQADGMDPAAILAALASLLNDYITNATNQATASAYFFGLAKHAAYLAAQDLPPDLKH